MKKVLALVIALAAGNAFGATAQSTFTVTATVKPSCTIATNTLNFAGTTEYDPFATTDLTVTNANGVQLTCSKGTVYTVTLGTGNGASYAPRKMAGPGGASLNYNIYTDSGLGTVWGDGSGSTGVVTNVQFPVANKNQFNIPMSGSIPALQDVAVGVYTDSVTATITF